LRDFLAHDLAPGAHPALRAVNRQLGNPLAAFHVLIEPKAKGILDHAGDKRTALA
jgi:hypothetical protein